MWLWPDSKAEIAKTWSGERGRLRAKTDVTLTASKLEFPNIEYELDGEKGTAKFKVLVNGERPIVNLTIDTPNADIDCYLSDGFAAFAPPCSTSRPQLLGILLGEQVKPALRLTM